MAKRGEAILCPWECGGESDGVFLACENCHNPKICMVCGEKTDQERGACSFCGTLSNKLDVEYYHYNATRNELALQSFHRLKRHMREVGTLLSVTYHQVQLEAGPQKVNIQGHRAFLAYYSEFFDKAIYGNFAEGAPNAILYLPVDEEQHVRAFVHWTYTGDVFQSFPPPSDSDSEPAIFDENNAALEKLWIFADKIFAPKFANDIMRILLTKYLSSCISPATAELVFTETQPDSKLRVFVKKSIQAAGPLREDMSNEVSRQEWLTVLAKGGDLVAENLLAGGFHSLTEEYPSFYPDCLEYFQEVGNVTALEWSKKRAYVAQGQFM